MNRRTILLALFGAPLAFADEKHDHSKESKEEHGHGHAHEKKVAGPNGGRIFTTVNPHFEFFVTPERKVKITFLGEDNKPLALAAQIITGTSGERANPVKLTFAKGKDADANVLISDVALPAGAHVPMVLTIKTTADAKAVTERFTVDMNDCETCKHKEYACTCDHSHGDHGHDH